MKVRFSISLFFAILLCSWTVQAEVINIVNGSLWRVPDAIAADATLANIPTTIPDITFDVYAPLNFDTRRDPHYYKYINGFLTTGGAFNYVANRPWAFNSLISDGVTGTIFLFTGFVTVTTGQQFTATHDDGLSLIIGGINLGFNSGPSSPTTSVVTYTGPSGNFAFQLVYGECSSPPAVLQIDLPFSNTPVPEPSAMLLLGSGLVGLVGYGRKKMEK